MEFKHILSVEQFDQNSILEIFDKTREYKQKIENEQSIINLNNLGKTAISLFYEPSTRTRLGFETDVAKLGYSVISTENAAQFSSAIKGETIEDTIKVLNGYDPKFIIIRHNEVGMVDRAAKVSDVPIINAGDGSGEHPTQAFIDLFTIHDCFKKTEDLKITFGGDLKYGRTVRSLAKILSIYKNNQLTFLSIPELRIEDDVKNYLKNNNTSYLETDNLKEALNEADVIYWTRIQKERFNSDNLKSNPYILNNETLKYIKERAIILHPLPRGEEINPEIDGDKRAKYFIQSKNGLYVRLALIDLVTKK